MKPQFLAALFLCTSILAAAQQLKVHHAQLHDERVGSGLSAPVGRFRNMPVPRWIGYEVPVLRRARSSACSIQISSPYAAVSIN